MPTFGQDTIWRFHKNVSELKRLAARDFEDLLQVGLSLISVLLNMIDVLHSVLFRSLQGCCLISVLRSGPVRSFFLFRKDQDQDRS